MKLDEAKVLNAALEAAIAQAEATGSTEVSVMGALSAELGKALDELQAAIDAAKAG